MKVRNTCILKRAKRPEVGPSILLIRDGEVTWCLLNIVGSLATTLAIFVLLRGLGLRQVNTSMPHLGANLGYGLGGTDCSTSSRDDSREDACYRDSAAIPCVTVLSWLELPSTCNRVEMNCFNPCLFQVETGSHYRWTVFEKEECVDDDEQLRSTSTEETSNFKEHMHYLQISWKCKLWFIRSGVEPEILNF